MDEVRGLARAGQGGQGSAEGAARLASEGAVAILLHCFGFSLAMRKEAAHASRLPVISVRSLLARALCELLQ
ncbi:MAG TPA: hypothetical protein ENL11_00790 [Candidatus Acetothermia bacterium]|nr:hypothetical protein [Candidatus Acetothermia bacterium]